MRLLDVSTYQLSEFYGEDVPPYAILSHTWGPGEVLFADVDAGSEALHRQAKDGLSKIQMACRRASEDDLRWIWIDTCCIDKSSSSELSEAINSMYQFYEDAEVCYAYLSDVSPYERAFGDPSNREPLSEELKLPGFVASRWHSRGWTLQELIAPKAVLFFNSAFQFLGSRRTLARILEQVTKVDWDILMKHRSPEEVCVARKMSWASARVTTRVEDRSYCLLGLFKIKMPLLYGEKETSFKRLQEEIMKSTNDQSIFAWQYAYGRAPTVLASDLRHFAHAGRMILWASQTAPEGHSINNAGLSITLPVLQSNDEMVGVLACRYDDDFRGPIGIPLTRSGFKDRWVRAKRALSIVPLKAALNAVPSKVLITHVGPSLLRTGGFATTEVATAAWIRVNHNDLASQDSTFHIVDTYPSLFWNRTTGTMRMGYTRHRGACRLVDSRGAKIMLVFGHERLRPLCAKVSHNDESTSLESLCGNLNTWDRGMATVSEDGSPMRTAKVTCQLDNIMGELVLIVNVECWSPSSSLPLTE